ncbi:MAG: hypothetical protein ACREA0_05705 [bacterium]
MKTRTPRPERILAIDATYRGFGFAVFEGPDRLLDWGVTESRDPRRSGVSRRLEDLIERYGVDVVVLEDVEAVGSRRRPRARKVVARVAETALRAGVKVRKVPRVRIRDAFDECHILTKHRIATAVAVRFPELAPRLPPYRLNHMTEDYRMAIFDAVAFGLAYSASRRRPEHPDRLAA